MVGWQAFRLAAVTSRRDFVKGVGATGMAGWLGACVDGVNGRPRPDSAPLPPDGAFDFPLGAPLPFAHGVASGDPLADRVIIWTRVTEESPSADAVPVSWELARDPQMQEVVRSGRQDAVPANDWTVQVDVTGLAPATTYYYRFAALGAQSLTGRTRTAPATAVDEIRIAVVSCSSYWSSHWSGYGHIADRNDLDLVVHCGDYVYDFVDEDEEVRARNGIFNTEHVDYRDWTNLAECRRRYALFRSDPHLLRAHQQHPWSIVWDNHDISPGYGNELPAPDLADQVTTTLEDVARAFYEWTPTRPPRADRSGRFHLVEDGSYPLPPDPLLLWRQLDYGPLLDIFCVDTQLHLRDEVETDASHLDGAPSLFSRPQFEWLTAGLLASQQAGKPWRLVLNQTWIAPITVPSPAPGLPSVDPLGVSRWSSYAEERAALFGYLRGANPAGERVRGTIVVSGDAHGNWGADLVEDNALLTTYQSAPPLPNPQVGSTPANIAAGYVRAATGNLPLLNNRADSVGVEFAGSSMGRGGADELIANANPLTTVADQVAGTRAIELAVMLGNKATQYIEWVDHGYGLVHIQTDRALFEYWWQDKLTPDSPDVLGNQMIAWGAEEPTALPAPRYRDQLDWVVHHGESVAASSGSRVAEPAPDGELNPR